MAILYPLKPRLQQCSTILVVLCTWLFSSLLSLPAVIFFSTWVDEGGDVCGPRWPNITHLHVDPMVFGLYYDGALMFFNYFIPFVVLCFSYIRVSWVLWSSEQVGEATPQQEENIKAKKKVSSYKSSKDYFSAHFWGLRLEINGAFALESVYLWKCIWRAWRIHLCYILKLIDSRRR